MVVCHELLDAHRVVVKELADINTDHHPGWLCRMTLPLLSRKCAAAWPRVNGGAPASKAPC